MAQLDWMHDPNFETTLVRNIESAFEAHGMQYDATEATGELLFLFSQNRDRRRAQEEAKPLSEQRSEFEALNSVNVIINTAVRIARDRQHDSVTRDDVLQAYQAQFCRVWPFC